MTDNLKHFICCALCALVMSSGIALLVWSSLIVCHCEEMMEHLLAPIWFGGFTSALAMGIGKEYGDECADGNKWVGTMCFTMSLVASWGHLWYV